MEDENKNDSVRVFINASSARRGGGQTYLVNLLKYIPSEYSDIQIFLLAPDNLEIKTGHMNLQRVSVDWPVENPFLRVIWEKYILPITLKKLRIDILFCPGGVISTPPPKGCKSVTMFRNMIPFDRKIRKRYPIGYMRLRNWILERVMLSSMLKADLVIFISEYAKQVVERFAQTTVNNFVVIPHGINPHFRYSENNIVSLPEWLPREGYFLYVSIFDVYKAQIEVVQSFAILKQRRRTKEKLILAGPENREYGNKLRSEIDRLGLKEDVLIVGVIPYHQLPSIYHHAKINIFASECENCPNILLEALGAGRPVFSSSCPPMAEFGGDAVIYFDPLHPEQLAEKICDVIDNPLQMENLSIKALKRSMLYQWDETAKATWKAILDLHYCK